MYIPIIIKLSTVIVKLLTSIFSILCCQMDVKMLFLHYFSCFKIFVIHDIIDFYHSNFYTFYHCHMAFCSSCIFCTFLYLRQFICISNNLKALNTTQKMIKFSILVSKNVSKIYLKL